MNLQGKIVKFHIYDQSDDILGTNKVENNYQDTCPALVITDWNPNEELKDKLLNLRVFRDCIEPYMAYSAVHVNMDEATYSIEDVTDADGNPVKIVSQRWELFED